MLFSTFAFMAITFFKLNKKSKVFGYLTTAVRAAQRPAGEEEQQRRLQPGY